MDNFRDSYFNVTWDLTKKHLRGTFWGKQYDTGRGFAVTIVEGGQVTVPSTETVRLKWEKPDGTEGYVTAVVVDDKFIIENIDQMFTVHSAVRSDLEIWRGGKVISSITFYVSVEKAVAVDAIESSSQFTALQEAVGSVDSLQQEIIDAREDGKSLGATIRESNATLYAQTKAMEEVDIFVIYGQSNARGYAYNTAGDPIFKTPNVTVWDGTTTIPLTNYMPSLNDGISTGGAWVAFANEYARKTGRKAILANCAKGSQSIDDLSKGALNINYSGMVDWVNSIKNHITTNQGKTVGKVAILWCQGEANSLTLADTTGYATKLNQLWTDIKADISADLFTIFTVGYYQDNRKLYAWVIQSIQREFAKNNTDVIVAFDDIESMASHAMKVDGVHLNQIGYNYMGEKGAQSIVPTLFTDTSYQQEVLINKQGLINLDGSQEWKLYGGWVSKATGTAFAPSTLTHRAVSNIVAVEIVDDHLEITLADRIDYILSVNASVLAVDSDIAVDKIDLGGTALRPVFDKKLYQTIDSEGRTVIKLYILADIVARVNLATQVLDTALLGSTLAANFSVTWGTGTCSITHPQTRKLTTASSNDTTTPYIVACSSGSKLSTIKCWNMEGAQTNATVKFHIEDIIINPSTLPSTFELALEIIGAKKRDS